ncbi:MAG: hypothetical protein R3A47_01755 [Polyangiales bacterium]
MRMRFVQSFLGPLVFLGMITTAQLAFGQASPGQPEFEAGRILRRRRLRARARRVPTIVRTQPPPCALLQLTRSVTKAWQPAPRVEFVDRYLAEVSDIADRDEIFENFAKILNRASTRANPRHHQLIVLMAVGQNTDWVTPAVNSLRGALIAKGERA